MHIENLWLEHALKDPVVGPRLRRLKLSGGHFDMFQKLCEEPDHAERWRTFLARGTKGGVLGVLNLDTRFPVEDDPNPDLASVGIYVDRKYRRQGIGTSLLHTARHQYPQFDFHVKPWSHISYEFFQSVDYALHSNKRDTG